MHMSVHVCVRERELAPSFEVCVCVRESECTCMCVSVCVCVCEKESFMRKVYSTRAREKM